MEKTEPLKSYLGRAIQALYLSLGPDSDLLKSGSNPGRSGKEKYGNDGCIGEISVKFIPEYGDIELKKIELVLEQAESIKGILESFLVQQNSEAMFEKIL